jgi:hypothetical protein
MYTGERSLMLTGSSPKSHKIRDILAGECYVHAHDSKHRDNRNPRNPERSSPDIAAFFGRGLRRVLGHMRRVLLS